jgi:hypothetical protein
VPVSCFLLFLCFRKVTEEIFSELDETKAEHPKIYQSFQKSEEETERGHGPATQQGGTAQPLVAHPTCVTALVHFWRCPFAYKDPRREKPKDPDQFSRNTSRSAAIIDPRSGGSRSSSRHPAGEGNRHRRSSSSPCLPSARWVSSLPWTMGP